jgi:LacI family transcriptional regulator
LSELADPEENNPDAARSPRSSRPTMSDVAALARVGLSTVSRVINGVATVDPDLAARVHKAAEALDYRHNLTASSLRRVGGKTRTIGLLLENVANPFSSALHRGVEDVARPRGVGVLAGSLDEEPARERELVQSLVARRVDGLIIVPTVNDHSYLLSEKRAGTAIVFADRPPRFLDADCVLTDNIAGARRGTRHLLEHGHQRIGFLGDLRTISTATLRHEGFVIALTGHGIPVDERLVRLDLHDIESAEAATIDLLSLDDPPTALFAGQNLITIGAIRALRSRGLQHEIALLGFDDLLLVDLLDPGVSVIAQDASAMGRAAAELLFRRLDGDDSPSEQLILPTRLITRGSGEIRPR